MVARDVVLTADHVIADRTCVIRDNRPITQRIAPLSKPIFMVNRDTPNDFARMGSKRSLGKEAFVINCSPMTTGETYWLVGYANGRPELHVASGIADARYFNGRTKSGLTMHLRAVTARAYPGMSGGPVFNSRGEVIAFVSAHATDGSNLALVKELGDTSVCNSADK